MPSEAKRDVSATIPATRGAVITPSDSTSIEVCRSLYIGVSGDVAVTMADGGNLTFVGVAAGSILPVQVSKVLSTGTNAASIIALY